MKIYKTETIPQPGFTYHTNYDYGIYCGISKKFPNKESKYQMLGIVADSRWDRYEDRRRFASTKYHNNLKYYCANRVKSMFQWLLCTAFTFDPNDIPYQRNVAMKNIPLEEKYSMGMAWTLNRPIPITKLKLGSNECYAMHKYLEGEFGDD